MNLEREKNYYRQKFLPNSTSSILGSLWRQGSRQSLNTEDHFDANSVKTTCSSKSFRSWNKLQQKKRMEAVEKARSLNGDCDHVTEMQPFTFELRPCNYNYTKRLSLPQNMHNNVYNSKDCDEKKLTAMTSLSTFQKEPAFYSSDLEESFSSNRSETLSSERNFSENNGATEDVEAAKQAQTCKWVLTTSLEHDLKKKEAKSKGGLCGRFVSANHKNIPGKVRFVAFNADKEGSGLNAFSVFMRSQLNETNLNDESDLEHARVQEHVDEVAVMDSLTLISPIDETFASKEEDGKTEVGSTQIIASTPLQSETNKAPLVAFPSKMKLPLLCSETNSDPSLHGHDASSFLLQKCDSNHTALEAEAPTCLPAVSSPKTDKNVDDIGRIDTKQNMIQFASSEKSGTSACKLSISEKSESFSCSAEISGLTLSNLLSENQPSATFVVVDVHRSNFQDPLSATADKQNSSIFSAKANSTESTSEMKAEDNNISKILFPPRKRQSDQNLQPYVSVESEDVFEISEVTPEDAEISERKVQATTIESNWNCNSNVSTPSAVVDDNMLCCNNCIVI